MTNENRTPSDGELIDARGLVERLREEKVLSRDEHGNTLSCARNPDGPEAADHIEAQSATIAQERGYYADLQAEYREISEINEGRLATIARLTAEVETMREALERVPIPARTEPTDIFSARMDRWLATDYLAALAPKEG